MPGRRAGQLIVIRGCMFAGKTGRLIDLLRAAEGRRQVVQAFKHRLDTRYAAQGLATHDGRRFPARQTDAAAEIQAVAGTADVVGIDEAQFFGRDLAGVCTALLARGCTVIVAGIHHDAWGQDFPPLPELAARADRVETLCAPCTACGQPAEYSQRVAPLVGADMVGGLAEYKPRCAACFVPLAGPAPVY